MLPNYLANIKSSGIYRFVFDKSEMPGQEAETLRLVIGYSEKGPFNTPVYITTEDEFKKIYGGTSKKMERYGMWFHRMAIQALKAGPILAFNVKNFEPSTKFKVDPTANKVDFTTFNPNSTIFNVDEMQEIKENLQMAIKDLYNTDRFWALEPEQLEEYVNDNVDKPGYITIATTDSKDTSVTIFMRGYDPKGFDVPFSEWYSAVLNGEEMPTYLEGHERDLVSQYFAELFIFRGEFTPEIAASDKLAKFFEVHGREVKLKPYIVNAFGEKIDTLDALAANDASNFVKKYSGILLPEFRNANNVVISLDAQVNADNYVHKLLMRFNQDMLYSIVLPTENDPGSEFQITDLDTTGWSNGPEQDGNMMSIMGVEPIIFEATFEQREGETEPNWHYDEGDHRGEPADFYKYAELTPETSGFSMVFADADNRFGKTGIREGDSLYIGELAHVVKISSEPDEKDAYIFNGEPFDTEDAAKAAAEATIVENHYEEYDFNSFISATDEQYGHGKVRVIGRDEQYTTVTVIDNDPEDPNNPFIGRNLKVMGTVLDPTTHYALYDAETSEEIVGLYVMCSETAEPTPYWTLGDTDYNNEEDAIAAADALVESETVKYTKYTVQLDKEDVSGDIYKCVGSVTSTSRNIKPCYLKGYTYGVPKPESTKQIAKRTWQEYMFEAFTNYRGLRIALTSRVDLEYRYLVDTFESFVGAECKAILSTLCKEKDNAFAILNFPQIKNFSKCDYISFRNEKGEFDTKYIPMGGNPLKRMSDMFTLPSQENGASWCGFFTCLKIRDVNTGVKEDIPAAALVSNNFMKKFTTYQPYTIIAGTNRGVIRETGLLGPDFNFGREDLDNLEPFGVNCMVYVDRKGTCINSNQTAKQNPVTTLSKINVRELVIFLQDEIEKLLLDYHWDFNTPNLQQRIKDRADVILETAKNNGGVYLYRNQCDKYNNTDDVINNEMLVLSTSIEPGMGAGKMVQELYIYRKGGMSSALISDTGA
jgi:hypothetical protein